MDVYISTKYWQKSFSFLYPLLGFRRESTFKPEQTFLWYPGKESIESWNLIVYYKNINSPLFDKYERDTLTAHTSFMNCYDTDFGRVYIYDLSFFAPTVTLFLEGKYSKFSDSVKKAILTYYGSYGKNEVKPGRPIHCALYPQLYFEEVAKEIKVPVEDLRDLGELCDKYNRERETLRSRVLNSCNLGLLSTSSLSS